MDFTDSYVQDVQDKSLSFLPCLVKMLPVTASPIFLHVCWDACPAPWERKPFFIKRTWYAYEYRYEGGYKDSWWERALAGDVLGWARDNGGRERWSETADVKKIKFKWIQFFSPVIESNFSVCFEHAYQNNITTQKDISVLVVKTKYKCFSVEEDFKRRVR